MQTQELRFAERRLLAWLNESPDHYIYERGFQRELRGGSGPGCEIRQFHISALINKGLLSEVVCHNKPMKPYDVEAGCKNQIYVSPQYVEQVGVFPTS